MSQPTVSADLRPTLLVSGVAERRSDDHRETMLTRRLMQGLVSAAGPRWHIEVSWGQLDGEAGTLLKLDRADAVVVMGGPDISPEIYGGAEHYPHEGPHFRRSDDAQMSLIRQAIARRVPLLGICRGMQAINVAQGGTLVQHLQSPGHTNAALLEDFVFSRHQVSVDRGSRVGRVFGVGGSSVTIHSAHHQAANRIGRDLDVVGYSADGVVEAVEHRSAPVFGVQWHPEDPDANPSYLEAMLSLMRR